MSHASIAFALAAALTAAPALAVGTETHSGTLTAIDPSTQTLTLEEMGPWRGPGTGLIAWRIVLSPATKVELIRRSKQPVDGGWPGGYVDSPLTPTQLHPGDFATIRVTRRGRERTATSIDVVRASDS